MPCGGIGPLYRGDESAPRDTVLECFQCGQPGASHWCIEWDCYLHARCVPAFLETPEGAVILAHEHEVVVDTHVEDAPEAPDAAHDCCTYHRTGGPRDCSCGGDTYNAPTVCEER